MSVRQFLAVAPGPRRLVACCRDGTFNYWCPLNTGSGTTGAVALRLGRSFVGIELNPQYAAMADRRLAEAWANGVQERIEGVA